MNVIYIFYKKIVYIYISNLDICSRCISPIFYMYTLRSLLLNDILNLLIILPRDECVK